MSRPTLRSVAFATRVSGRLDPALLQVSITELERRHEALRTRIVTVDAVPEQHVEPSGSCALDLVDLTTLSKSRQAAQLEQLIHEVVLKPVNVALDPLFATRLIRLRTDEHVFIAATEHIISDGYSLNVLLRDLFAIYSHGGHAHALPPVVIQLADYATWQRQAHRAWLKQHEAYWSARLRDCSRLQSPRHRATVDARELSWARLSFSIEAPMKSALLAWSKDRRTTLVLAVLTAFVGLILRWYDTTDAVIPYQTDGRFSPLVQHSIGYFAVALKLRVSLHHEDTFLSLLGRVTEEYCAASERSDCGYLDTQIPAPPYTHNPGFNWVPHTLGARSPLADTNCALTFSPVPFSVPGDALDASYDWDHEPVIVLQDGEHAIDGAVVFSPRRVSVETMCKFQCTFLEFLAELLERPARRIRDIHLQRTA